MIIDLDIGTVQRLIDEVRTALSWLDGSSKSMDYEENCRNESNAERALERVLEILTKAVRERSDEHRT